MSTRVLAAGWTTSSSFMIVAPSLEMVVLPERETREQQTLFKEGESTLDKTLQHAKKREGNTWLTSQCLKGCIAQLQLGQDHEQFVDTRMPH